MKSTKRPYRRQANQLHSRFVSEHCKEFVNLSEVLPFVLTCTQSPTMQSEALPCHLSLAKIMADRRINSLQQYFQSLI